MKKNLIAFFILLTCMVVIADRINVIDVMTPAVTSLAATSTNSTAGTIYNMIQGPGAPPDTIRLYAQSSGTAATTNGNLIVKFSLSTDGVTFDDAPTSLVKLTLPATGTSTNQISDWFQISGARYIRVGQIENTSAGTSTPIAIRISFNQDR